MATSAPRLDLLTRWSHLTHLKHWNNKWNRWNQWNPSENEGENGDEIKNEGEEGEKGEKGEKGAKGKAGEKGARDAMAILTQKILSLALEELQSDTTRQYIGDNLVRPLLKAMLVEVMPYLIVATVALAATLLISALTLTLTLPKHFFQF
jgi:hypothetical protein